MGRRQTRAAQSSATLRSSVREVVRPPASPVLPKMISGNFLQMVSVGAALCSMPKLQSKTAKLQDSSTTEFTSIPIADKMPMHGKYVIVLFSKMDATECL